MHCGVGLGFDLQLPIYQFTQLPNSQRERGCRHQNGNKILVIAAQQPKETRLVNACWFYNKQFNEQSVESKIVRRIRSAG